MHASKIRIYSIWLFIKHLFIANFRLAELKIWRRSLKLRSINWKT